MWLVWILLTASLAQAGTFTRQTEAWHLTATEEAGRGITVRFELLDYRLERTEAGVRVELPGVPTLTSLPVISTWVEVPDQAGIALEELTCSEALLPGLRPAPQFDGSDQYGKSTPPAASPTTLTADRWPQPVRLLPPAVMRDRRLVQISFAPFRSGSDGNSLVRCDTISLRISYQGDDFTNSGRLAPQRPTRVAEQLFDRLLLNYRSRIRDTRDITRGGYVIFFPEAARTSLYPLLEWKRQLGWEVDTVAADALDSYQMLAHLQERWDSGETFDFVLLVGDKDLYPQSLPLDAFFFNGTDHSEPEWNYQDVTDHPFSLLAGDDYLPEVSVGRLSVDTIGELQAVVAKILRYERDIWLPEDDPNWPDRALMVCDWMWAWSRREVMRQVRDDLLGIGYAQVDTAYSHTIINPLPVSSISIPVNNGVSFVNYRGYGHRFAWATPYFTNADIDASIYNTNKLPIITSIVCGGGDFASYGVDPCFGEKWLRHGTIAQQRGAVAFIGPSELDTHTRWNNTIDLGVYYGIIQERLHYLGPVLTRGKLELYLNNPDFLDPGSPTNSVHFYFHTYNLLGDPGLQLMVGTPATPVVQFPSLIPLEQEQVAVRVTAAGAPAAACVALYDDQTDEVRCAWTDAGGMAVVDVPTGTERIWTLTVSGYGLIPYQSTILQSTWQQSPALLSLVPEAGEELVVGENQQVWLRAANYGVAPLAPVLIDLQAEGATFGDDFLLPEIPVDSEVLSENSVELLIDDPGLVLTAHRFQAELTEGMPAVFHQLLHGRRLEIDSCLWIDGNNQLPERGETGTLSLQLRNSGDRGFETATLATLTLSHWLTAAATQYELPPLPPAGQTVVDATVTVDEECVDGSVCEVMLAVEEGLLWTAAGAIGIGVPGWSDPAGPDAGGYYVYHSEDDYQIAPQYDWLELDPEAGGPGMPLGIYDPREQDPDDPYGQTEHLDLPINFNFYGESYDEISICSNGWIAPGFTNLTSWRNSQIPGANGPAGLIAPLWDDLCNWDYIQEGDIFYWYDLALNRFLIEWSDFSIANGSSSLSVSFQVELRDASFYPTFNGDSEILFHYLEFNNLDSWENYATIGIEDPTERFGLEYSFNNRFLVPNQELASEQSLKFTSGILPEAVIPDPPELTLRRGYPNPFNSRFTLEFELTSPGPVTAVVYNLLGEEVARLSDGRLAGGRHRLHWDAAEHPSGLYLYRVQAADGATLQGKCLLLR